MPFKPFGLEKKTPSEKFPQSQKKIAIIFLMFDLTSNMDSEGLIN